MRLAYQITAHQNPAQLVALLAALQHPDNLYLIQPDSKSLSGQEAVLQQFARQHPNVIIAKATDLRWASWSLMQSRLDGIAQLLARPEPWQMLINLSGQDFPLQSQDAIRAWFDGKGEQNFLEHFDPHQHWVDPMARIERIRLELPFMKSGWNVPKLRRDRWTPNLGADTRYVGGSRYMVLNRAFCEHLMQSPRLPAWRQAMTRTYRPDEVMVQSFIMNSPFADTVQNRHVHEVDWRDGGSHPKVFTMEDLPRLEASEQLFARKFDPAVDAEVLKALAARLARS
ncbi:MAG: beta-1,6-N-acetylglucosaminyltransferase [Lautropia sp.]|nr:beta-1,6-N-acetylglucosaminyltransferase [Lautropia sp.]